MSACAIVGGAGALGTALIGQLPPDIEPIVIDVRRPPTAATFRQCDIRVEAEIAAAFEGLSDTRAEIPWLVNCAAAFHGGAGPAVSLTDFANTLALNVAGPWKCALAWFQHFGRPGGLVVNVTSASAVRASMDTPYSASKAALEAVSRSLARHFAPAGVSVVAVAPGIIDSPMSAALSAQRRAALRDATFSGAETSPAAVAVLIRELMTSPSAFLLSGQTIRCDDGLSIPK